ncbi:hypothetical protein D3C74_412110 [compost metagenome]
MDTSHLDSASKSGIPADVQIDIASCSQPQDDYNKVRRQSYALKYKVKLEKEGRFRTSILVE